MLLRFPDAATLAAALRDGVVPPAVARQAVCGARDAAGAVWIEPPPVAAIGPPTEAVQPLPGLILRDAWCWAEFVPPVSAVKDHAPAALFHIPNPNELSRVLAELRRLVSPGVGFLWYGRGTNQAFVVRVPEPPAHVLARRAGVVPFVKRAADVWVEAGFDHPLIDQIRPRRGRRYLIPADGPWLDVPTAPFKPVDARPVWALAPGRARLIPSLAPAVFSVPARLRTAEPTERPDFWVLAAPSVGQLHAVVKQSDGRLLDDLDFAVSTDGAVAVRARRSRTGPVVLSLPATAFVPLLKLPNVYLPAGSRLRPPVRRDVLRERLYCPDRVTWLAPGKGGTFSVVSVPADAFRPLAEWVEYTVPLAVARRSWRPTTALFTLDAFETKAGPQPGAETPRRKSTAVATIEAPRATPPVNVVKGTGPAKPIEPAPGGEAEEIDVLPTSEAVRRLHELEGQFLAINGPFDAPERLALWPRLAELATAAGQDDDAGLCWANALWDSDSAVGARRWARAEQANMGHLKESPPGAEPPLAELRAAAAWVINAAARPGPEAARRVPTVARMLEEHDHRLPVRVAWLAWVAIAKLSGGDVLALTRARDRLLHDLLEGGLKRDRDFPTFLRGVTRGSEGRAADVPLLWLREWAWDWCRGASGGAVLRVFVDLTFAYALARFGDTNAARALLADVGSPDDPLESRKPHRPGSPLEPYEHWLWEAYIERVRRQLAGEPAAAPLSADLRRKLDGLRNEYGTTPGSEQRRTAERFLRFSRILEPFARTDPYRLGRPNDELEAELAGVATFTAPARKRDKAAEQIELRLRDMIKRHKGPHPTLRVLGVAVPLSVRVGEAFALECLAQVRPTLTRAGRWRDLTELIDRVSLLETAAGVAAHFGRVNLIGGMLNGLHALLKDIKGEIAAWVVAALGGGSFRFLSRLGLADEAKAMLGRMTEAVTEGQSVGKLLKARGLNREVVYPALLRLAGGWFYFGDDGPARQALAAARVELFDGSMSPEPRNRLAEAYATALGHAPLDEAMTGFAELFERLSVVSFDPLGTIHRLRVVEAVTLATASEDFAFDARSRRWLDEDEFLIRRRIHRDVQAALGGAGLG